MLVVMFALASSDIASTAQKRKPASAQRLRMDSARDRKSADSVAPGSLWYRDAVCETGHDPPYWNYGKPGSGHGGPAYEGGIGFAPATWRWWGGKVGGYPRWQHAYDAPPEVQAAAAEWGLENVGRWGCVWQLTR